MIRAGIAYRYNAVGRTGVGAGTSKNRVGRDETGSSRSRWTNVRGEIT